jgi:branched-chain amino acid transport system permease protein
MVYGIIELINFAHGEIYMIGAFHGPDRGQRADPAGAAPIGHPGDRRRCCRGLFRPTATPWKRSPTSPAQGPALSALISAIGMSLFLQNYVLLAQTSDFLPFPSLIPIFEFWNPMPTSSRTAGNRHHSSPPPSSWSC